jgi:hypothetical protein
LRSWERNGLFHRVGSLDRQEETDAKVVPSVTLLTCVKIVGRGTSSQVSSPCEHNREHRVHLMASCSRRPPRFGSRVSCDSAGGHRGGEGAEELADDVALGAASGLAIAIALRSAADDVGLVGGVGTHAGDMDGSTQGSVSASVWRILERPLLRRKIGGTTTASSGCDCRPGVCFERLR